MVSSVLPPFSSKVAVVTAPASPASSLYQTRRQRGTTSWYLPKNAIGSAAARWLNTRRYPPPTRTSRSHESRVMPSDFGTHHFLNSSGLVNASNTMRAGPLMVRVTTTSRSDFRSTVVWFFMRVGSLSVLVVIGFLLPFEFQDNLVQLVEACVPHLAVPLEPCHLFLQSARAEFAGPYAPDLLRGDEPGLFQHADVLLHAREGHAKLLGEVGNRRVGTSQLLQHAAPGGIRQRGEGRIEAGWRILNHMVQYIGWGSVAQGPGGQAVRRSGGRAYPCPA